MLVGAHKKHFAQNSHAANDFCSRAYKKEHRIRQVQLNFARINTKSRPTTQKEKKKTYPNLFSFCSLRSKHACGF